jgi:flavoprotein
MIDARIEELEKENQHLKEKINALTTLLKAVGKMISDQEAISAQSAVEFDDTCPYCSTSEVFEDDDVDGLARCNGCGKCWFNK